VGTEAGGTWSLVAPVAGVRAQGATSLLDRVTVGLGGVQMGWAGVNGLASRRGAGMGLAKGDGGLLDLLGHPFALGSMSEVGERDSFALGAVSPVIWLAIGSRVWLAGVEGWKSPGLGTGPMDVSTLVAQSNRACSRGAGLTGVLAVVDGAWSRTSSWVPFISSSSPVSASRRSFSRSLAPSSFSTPFPSLLTPGSPLSCCLTVVMGLFESVVVAAVVVVVS
jgi:hypothetical protein